VTDSVAKLSVDINQAVSFLSKKLDLSTDDAATLVNAAKLVVFKKGEVLFKQGDQSASFFIILRGQLKGQRVRPDGHVDLVLSFFSGEIIGELGFFDHSSRTLSISARRESLLLEINEASLQKFGLKSGPVYNHLIRVLVSRFKRELGYSSNANQHQFMLFQNLIPDVALARKVGDSFIQHLSSRSQLNVWSRVDGFSPDAELLDDLHQVEWIETNAVAPLNTQLVDDLDAIVIVLSEATLQSVALCDQVVCQLNELDHQLKVWLILLHENKHIQKDLAVKVQQRFNTVSQVLHLRLDYEVDYARVSRYLLGQTVGLVLGGGGARGFAHAGFYRALEEAGVCVDAVGGTSMGALVGALISSGRSALEVEQALAESFKKGLPFSFKDYLLPKHGFVRSRSVDALYQRAFGTKRIEDQLLPFFAVSCNLTTGNQYLFEQGAIWQAVRASTSIPVFFEPFIFENHVMVDGALVNNVPVDFMRAKGAKHVITVDVGMEEDMTSANHLPSPPQLPSVLKSLMRVIELGGIAKSRQARTLSDVYVQPRIEKIGLMEFERRQEVIELGYEAGKASIQDILALF
jgi:predicted acylesterase/phospholipase RssA/CRP-like cAMP-binding protein